MKKLAFLAIAIASSTVLQAADTAARRAALVDKIRAAEIVLQEFQIRPQTAIPPAVWQRARAVIVVRQFKAGLILGYQGGHGVMLVKQADGRWSLPVLVSATEGSVGFQIGAATVDSIYVITDDTTPKLLFNRRFNVGVDAKAVAGPVASEAERTDRPILETPVLIYSRNLGLFAGATVKAATLASDDQDNFLLYNTRYRLPELLYGNWVTPPPEVQGIMTLLQRLAP